MNQEFDIDIKKELLNIESFSDSIIEFAPSIKYFKKFYNQIILNFNGLGFNYLIYSINMNRNTFLFRNFINSYLASHIRFEEISKLSIQADPWDNYNYYDSKIIFDMICNSKINKLNINNITNEKIRQIEDFLLMKFAIYLIQNDFNSNINGRGNKIFDELIKFFNERDNEALVDLFDISLKIKAVNENQKTTKEIAEKEDIIKNEFDKFIEYLIHDGAFLNIKKDYFI